MASNKTGEILFLGDDGHIWLSESYQDEVSGEVITQQTKQTDTPVASLDNLDAETVEFVEVTEG